MTALLNEMEARIGPSFKQIKASMYKDHKQGFYVFAKKQKCNPSAVTKYIGRYLGRPVIATKRIDKYDGDFVTFHYNRHEDNQFVSETIPALDFCERLIRHIPDKHFKMIRYYGIYARHRETDKQLRPALSEEKKKFFLSLKKWRDSILVSFGYDPLECPSCKTKMLFQDLYFNHKRVSLQKLYQQAIADHPECRSPG